MLARLCIFMLLILWATSCLANVERLRISFRTDPATSMVVGWDQVTGDNPLLYYDTQSRQGDLASYAQNQGVDIVNDYAGMQNKFVRLQNLKPNTTYYFVIGDSEGVSKEYSFETLPNNSAERISIIAGGDSRNYRAARKAANLMVAKLHPHLVMFGGDMTGGDNAKQWIRWMNDWQLSISPQGRITPIVTARGNHEYSNKSIVALFDVPTLSNYYSLPIGGNLARLYTLNSLIAAGGDQAEWLEDELVRYHDDVYWQLAQYHFATRPHTSRKAERNDQWHYWSKLFFNYGVDLVVESDAHVVKTTYPIRPSKEKGSKQGFIRDDKRGTVYVGEGCWGAPLRDNDDDKKWTRASGSFNQFKWMFIDREGIEVRTIKTDNAEDVGNECITDRFCIPSNIDIWNPATGDVIYITQKKDISSIGSNFSKPKIEVLDFNAISKNDKKEIKWITKNENDTVNFELQKVNIFGGSYTTIAKVTGQGSSNEKNYYRFIDKEDSADSEYRLKKISSQGVMLFYLQ